MSPPQWPTIIRQSGRVKVSTDGDDTLFELINADDGANVSTPKAEVVLDYGQCEGGTPVFKINSASGAEPEIRFRVVYSETYEGISKDTGDGPFFLFSSAMDSYRTVSHSVRPSPDLQEVKARFAQRSQRYQRITLETANASLAFSGVGFELARPRLPPQSSFSCSDETLNRVWRDGVHTVDMCTVVKGETRPAWDVTSEGTRVRGNHWAPCRQGTRWGDKIVRFQVRVEEGGASWGVHMVANGVVCGLDVNARNLKIVEGLALSGGLFPAVEKGTWQIPQDIDLSGWLDVETTAKGDSVSVSIHGREIAVVNGLKVRPLLGGSGINTGSVALGGPAGWSAVYRALAVTDLAGKELYTNELRDDEPTLSDFQVGTNHLSCTVDGAKRDRACFGGDLYVMGRSVAYSTAFFEAVKGSIQLLLSHQTSSGYIGNLCPIQAPEHDGPEEPPTYAFYSLTYGLLLVVAVKEFWLHSGDHAVVQKYLDKLKTFMAFVESMVREDGLVEAPPPLSMHWFPLAGPIFGISTPLNLAYLDAIRAMLQMAQDDPVLTTRYQAIEQRLATAIPSKLRCQSTGNFPLGSNLSSTGSCLDVLAYANTLNLANDACATLNARLNQHPNHAPPAFLDIPGWDASGVVSPYSTGFAVEALFAAGQARRALDLVRGVWGPMADPRGSNYSGAHWEAMRADGTPFNHDVSLVHGWSTWPVFLLPKYLAGLRPIEPGWKRFAVEPVFAGLELVECSLATPSGSIHVELRVDDVVGAADLTLRVPVGAEAVVKAPVGWVLQGEANVSGSEHALHIAMRRIDGSSVEAQAVKN